MSDNIEVLLVGAGNMGIEYCKVLKAQNYTPIVVSRGAQKAETFKRETGIDIVTGGIDRALQKLDKIPTDAIIAVNADQLYEAALTLIENGVKKILIEKPAGLNRREIEALNEGASKHLTKMYVAYNRRFYASTEKALDIIKSDGGVTSFHFEFTEWGHLFEKGDYPEHISDAHMLGNSSHVIDLAFFLGGEPIELSTYISGEGNLSWHKRCSAYAGAGRTNRGALFSYHANWDAPGRWSVEVFTKKHRLYFKPMEQLAVQDIGTLEVKTVDINDSLDKKYKPGLYNQVKAFMTNETDERLITIGEHAKHMDFYEKIECR